MKKFVILALFTFVITSCGSNETKTADATSTDSTAVVIDSISIDSTSVDSTEVIK